MALLRSVARRLSQTRFGRKALTKPDGMPILKQRPGTRVYIGLGMLVLSYVTGLPALAFLGYLAVKLNQALILAVGGPIVLVLVHVMFAVGVYLAGRNYALEVAHRVTRRFLQKYV